ncbi:hepatocellular carcinoma-associated antigen 59-domain-containing protein [Aspergillus pseudoustus]|uniref:Hepatocellular carcinoma-associated antigen 59-domain-containing protein n=1 Tax=Aspergillus pseudoustus TaxID=1810923 RepID=A0ABR4JW72_9EURO
MDTEVGPNPEVLFRPFKRRKFQRRRPDETDSQQESPASNDVSESQNPQSDTDFSQTTEAHRLRRIQRSRKGGIEFSATSRPSTNQASQTLSSTAAEDIEGERLRAMCDRFTAHTGQTVDVDKHMMDYIESELAKRYRQGMPGNAPSLDSSDQRAPRNAPATPELPEREPAALGKLHEIDLGQETKLRNIARTEEATRRMNGNDDDPPTYRSPKKPSQYRKRRTSEDIARDRLVEEVLRESRLDVYDEPEEEAVAADDQAADDRVAEQFRREFMDAIQSRRRVSRMKPATKQTEAPKGPKLGGSRSARAAMREMQEKGTRK